MRIVLLALVCAFMATCQEYPKGVVTRYTLAPGKFYPGTPHNYAVYVPAKYDASKPVPFMIYLDGSGALGNQQRVPEVFDELIAKGGLPPLVGIFIDPGVTPATADDAQSRYERIFEYDNLSPRFAEFLEAELISEVGKKLNLSKRPDDHAIAGVSTGAVGAFMAAWNRPDLFHRVLSFIGTYVSMKGGDSLPAMIRRTEPKPIRIFMQDGKNDHIVDGQPYGTFYGGSWPINNQVMYEAFQFAGYDVRFEMTGGTHSMADGSKLMAEALQWLWREYPKPVVAHDPAQMSMKGWDARGQVFGLISMEKPWEQVGPAHKSVASPVEDRDRNVYFVADGSVYKGDQVFRQNANASVIRVGADGRIYAVQPLQRRIVSWGPDGDEKVVATGVEAVDIALTAKNEIYFTALKAIGYVGPRGPVYTPVEMLSPSGMSLSPDQKMLIVGDGQSRFSWSFQIAKDGSLENGEPFYRVEVPELARDSGVAAVTVDAIGQAYFADALGIQFCEQNGRCAGVLNKPEPGTLSGLAFIGDWLYVAENGKMFRRPVKQKGVTAWGPVMAPKPPL